ncbi:MAG: hypothetical protein GY788_23095 [bacterium]|nr:hypothetical protein [bacterium]
MTLKKAVIGEPIIVAEMYSLWTLDCIVDVAHAVALDFVKRPRHYRRVPGQVAIVLEQIKAWTGNQPEWPDNEQRAAIFGAILGASDAKAGGDRTEQFHLASAALREAAAAFAERVYDTGVAMLRQRFSDSVITLRAHLKTLEGRVVTLGYKQTRAIFDNSRSVFANAEVAAAFGLPPAPGNDWPLAGTFSGDGAYLIEEITRVLRPESTGLVPERQITVLQRIADYGQSTIAGVMNDSGGWDSDDCIDGLIRDAYSWMAALRDLGRP